MIFFNKALLAKQAWRLITNPSFLLARVYKTKYLRKTSFSEAQSYQTSNYAWESILSKRNTYKAWFNIGNRELGNKLKHGKIIGFKKSISCPKRSWIKNSACYACERSFYLSTRVYIVKSEYHLQKKTWRTKRNQTLQVTSSPSILSQNQLSYGILTFH